MIYCSAKAKARIFQNSFLSQCAGWASRMGRANFDKCMYSFCYFCEYLSMIVGFLYVSGSVAFISCGTRLLATDPPTSVNLLEKKS